MECQHVHKSKLFPRIPQQVIDEEGLGGATAASEGGMMLSATAPNGLFLHHDEILRISDAQIGTSCRNPPTSSKKVRQRPFIHSSLSERRELFCRGINTFPCACEGVSVDGRRGDGPPAAGQKAEAATSAYLRRRRPRPTLWFMVQQRSAGGGYKAGGLSRASCPVVPHISGRPRS